MLGCVWAHMHIAESDMFVDSAFGPSVVLGTTAMNIMLAASSGAVVGMLLGHIRYGKPDLFYTYTGLLAGLVAISAGAASIGNIGAVVTGGIAGLVVPLLSLHLDMSWHLDDPLGMVAVHGAGGIWGTLAAALFAPAEFGERMRLLGVQLLGIACIVALSLVVSLIVFVIVKATIGVRVTGPDEFDGLDLGEHDINAYPDFQQTTIKSYHLREA
jgi:Amt family ammonium transporter